MQDCPGTESKNKPGLAPEDAYQRFCEHVGDDAHLIQKPGESFKMLKEYMLTNNSVSVGQVGRIYGYRCFMVLPESVDSFSSFFRPSHSGDVFSMGTPTTAIFSSRSQRKAIRMGATTAFSTLPRHARLLRLRAVVPW